MDLENDKMIEFKSFGQEDSLSRHDKLEGKKGEPIFKKLGMRDR